MKKVFSIFAIATAMFFSSCSSDDSSDSTGGGSTAGGDISSIDDVVATDLRGDVTGDVTLSGDYTLTGTLRVKDGAVLRLSAGTTLEATAGGTDVIVTVEQGGEIYVNGTAANPVVMTSNAANKRAGDWGGLELNGRATISGTTADATSSAEVTSLTYGGGIDNDKSGEINYLVLEYTGARINDTKEANGLTLNGVGSETVINNVAIIAGGDDAIEFFGGTVTASNILAVDAFDDMLDWTQGFTGTVNNFYGVRNTTAVSGDPRGIEADGNLDGNSPDHINQSNPIINGLTLIHNAEVDMSDMIKIRRGSGATITNAYVAYGEDSNGASDFIDLTDSKGNSDGDNTSITVVANSDSGVNEADIKLGDTSADDHTVTTGTSGGVDASTFSWVPNVTL